MTKTVSSENVLMHVKHYGKHLTCVLSFTGSSHNIPVGHVLLLAHFVCLANKIEKG